MMKRFKPDGINININININVSINIDIDVDIDIHININIEVNFALLALLCLACLLCLAQTFSPRYQWTSCAGVLSACCVWRRAAGVARGRQEVSPPGAGSVSPSPLQRSASLSRRAAHIGACVVRGHAPQMSTVVNNRRCHHHCIVIALYTMLIIFGFCTSFAYSFFQLG